MNIPVEKWLVMVLLTVMSIFLGMIPHLLVRYSKSMVQPDSTRYKVAITVLSCFGGGVLFATSMLHLLPEVKEGFQEVRDAWGTLDEHFPVAEAVVLAGFCLIYLVEEVAHFIMVDGHHDHHHQMNTVARHNSVAHALPIPNVTGAGTLTVTPRSSVITLRNRPPSISISIHRDSNSFIGQSSDCRMISNNNGLLFPNTTGFPGISAEQKMQIQTIMEGDTRSQVSSLSQDEECPDDKIDIGSSLRTFLALIALSFHAIMEGVTIGLQNSSNVWVMFGAVASHKFVISFCMGMELVASQTKTLTYISSIVFFAVISPIGIIIGSVLASDETTKSFPVLIIEGLASGTLLYVVFFEILNRERERKSYSMSNSKAIGFIQFVALVIGVVGMGALLTLTHNSHSNDSDVNGTDNHSHGHSP